MDLADRMRAYEAAYARQQVIRAPLVVRVDGRAFHSLLSLAKKPFDRDFAAAMDQAATWTARQMQGFVFGYVQSDEASFMLRDDRSFETDAWFGGDINKIVSISASAMTLYFGRAYRDQGAMFDARAFTVPESDVVNYFLWRARDWSRNSLTMYARTYYSHAELHGKGHEVIHEMLHEKGKNWATDVEDRFKNGCCLWKEHGAVCMDHTMRPEYADVEVRIGKAWGKGEESEGHV